MVWLSDNTRFGSGVMVSATKAGHRTGRSNPGGKASGLAGVNLATVVIAPLRFPMELDRDLAAPLALLMRHRDSLGRELR